MEIESENWICVKAVKGENLLRYTRKSRAGIETGLQWQD